LRITSTSAAVIGPHGVARPTSVPASKPQASGSPITPSRTPSPTVSQASIVAARAASNLHGATGLPDVSIASWPQIWPVCISGKLITGAPAAIPSYSSGKRCASITPWRPPVEQPLK
jgi:hypothetical protein